MTTRESDLLRHIYERSGGMPPRVRIGPGDDCALLAGLAPGALLTIDQFVEGRHYHADWPVDLIARNAVGRALSDIAAMGGRPSAALAAASLSTHADRHPAPPDALFDRMAYWTRHWQCPLIGGDIAFVDGPSVLSVVIVGSPHASRGAVRRNGARAGDALYLTGAIGEAKAAGWKRPVEPRLEQGAWLCDALGDRLHAMIDLSDGLGRDGGRMSEASGARLVIDAGALPLAEGVADWREAIGAGDDYELLFACAGEPPPSPAPGSVSITRIGAVEAGAGCVVRTPEGEETDAAALGWDHTDEPGA